MGNIQREVCPVKDSCLRLRAWRAVNNISMHQPVKPHFKKFFHKFFIIIIIMDTGGKNIPMDESKKENIMSFQETMDYIEGLQAYGSVPGLTNIQNLCKKLGNPQEALTFVHLAGTNGKGSVLSFVSTVLKEAGYRTGRYLSPTVFDYRERLQINGRMISKKDLCRLMTLMKEACEKLVEEGKPHPTPFEIETAMGFCYFKEQSCDIVVLETGMGGEMDATNIVQNTAVAVFTSISLDHMGILGNTLSEIAEQKAGIIKTGCRAVTAKQTPEVLSVLKDRCTKQGVEIAVADAGEAHSIKSSLEKQRFSYKEYRNLEITMAGRYQIENAVLAIETVKALSEKGFPVTEKALYRGLQKAVWQGRFQVLCKKPVFIADGAHNRDGAARLADSIRFYFTNKRIIYIMGILRDKEQDEIIKATCPYARQILTVPTKGIRGTSSYELACEVRNFHDNVTALDSVEEAVELSFLLSDKETVIIAFGSLSYLGNLIKTVENRDKIRSDSHGK